MKQETQEFLVSRYEASRQTQASQGASFEITLEEYLGLWKRKPWYLKEIARHVAKGNALQFLRSDSGFVLGWRSKQDRALGVMRADNAEILRREASKRRHQLQAGEHHRPESREKISLAKRGKPQSEKHRAAIGHALRGVPKSAESNAKRSEAAKARWATKRAATASAN